MRRLTVVAALLSLLVVSIPGSVAAQTPPGPSAPTNLSASLPGSSGPLSAGSWVSSTKLDLRMRVQVGTGTVVPQVEVEPFGTAFTGQPTFSGPALTKSGATVVPVSGLSDAKTYHWQARVIDGSGVASPWVSFSTPGVTTPDFGVDRDAPSRPTISSITNPSQSRWYHTRVEQLNWTSSDSISGVHGYTVVVERQARVIRPGKVTPTAGIRLTGLADGSWIVAVRSVDRAGNWSPTATYRLLLDRHAPQITWLTGSHFTFNPYKGPVSIRFRLNKDSQVQLGLYRVGSRKPLRTYYFAHLSGGRVTKITWNGRSGNGRLVARGYYFFSIKAVDHANNVSHWNRGGMYVNPLKPQPVAAGVVLYPGSAKRIIVSLSRQALYLYAGTHLVMQTLVTTGNPSLPTPLGSYTVLEKLSPFEFVSPWPPGSPYWYAPSWVQWAMLFRQGGYFLHDAPWRSVFGPGSNGPGQPGTNYGGTHGCVNIPSGAMHVIWNWAPVGTPVQIVP